jgi:hypothetical protein
MQAHERLPVLFVQADRNHAVRGIFHSRPRLLADPTLLAGDRKFKDQISAMHLTDSWTGWVSHEAFSLRPAAFSLQPSAFSLQPSAFSLRTAACGSLQPADCSLQPAAAFSLQPAA